MSGLLGWVDPTREWFKSRPEALKGLLSGAYSMATDPKARQEAMARQPAPFTDESAAKYQGSAEGFWNPTGLLGTIGNMPNRTRTILGLSNGGALGRAEKDMRFTGMNPKTLVKKGLLSPDVDVAAAYTARDEIKKVREYRNENSPLKVDPLEIDAKRRATKAAEIKAEKDINSAASFADWGKAFQNRVIESAKAGDGVEREARLAMLEAITREAKKLGIGVSHKSSEGGRVTSRYFEVPNIGRIRVSDHDLPMTFARESNYQAGHKPSWVRDIVVDDWRSMSAQDYIKKFFEE